MRRFSQTTKRWASTLALLAIASASLGSAIYTPAPTGLPGDIAPGAPISSSVVIGPTNTRNLIQAVAGGYTLTLGTIVVGRLYQFTHVGGAAGTNLFGTTGQAVTLSRGANTFTITNPQDTLAAPANSVQFLTSGVTYSFVLDATGGVFRCVGLS